MSLPISKVVGTLVLFCLFFSLTTHLTAQTYNNPGGTVTDCSGSFFDSGGSTGTYLDNELIVTSFCPNVAGECVTMDFTSFDLESNFDFLYVNQGMATGTGTAMSYTGVNSPGTVTSVDPSGCLTFIFTSDISATNPGWAANIACATCGAPPPCTGSTPTCANNPPDECDEACSLGVISTPPSCPTGGVVTNSFCLSNVGASAEVPYSYLAGCEDGTDMANPAADVWYSFVATSNELVIEVLGLTNPSLGVYQGSSCGTMIGRGCDNGLGILSLTIDPVSVGETYFLQISGGDINDVGDFTLNINSVQDCQDCLLNNTLTATPSPVNGVYQPGQTVEFCYTINEWNQTASNWIHVVEPILGSGWDATTLVPTSTPPSCDGDGSWAWETSITSTNTGLTVGPAFGYDSSAGSPFLVTDGDPGNNYGDNCQGAGNTWTFCWQVTTDLCPPNATGNDLNMTVETYGDYETGSWTSSGCQNDPVTTAFALISCCPQPLVNVDMDAACATNCTGAATVTGQGSGPFNYIWEDSAGNVIQTNNNLSGADQATGLCPGTYGITVTDTNDNCSTITTATIGAGGEPTVSISPENSTICNGATEVLTAAGTGGSGMGYSYNWTLPDATTATGTTVTATMDGVYSVTVTDSGGCTGTNQTNVSVTTASTTITASNTVLDCTNTTATLDAGAGFTTYNWSDATSGQTTTATSAGDYSVTVTDANGCTATDMISITENPTLQVTNISEDCNASNTAYTVSFDITGGSGNYLVDAVAILGSNYTSPPITSGSAYSFTVSDDTGCTVTISGSLTCIVNSCSAGTGCFGPNLITNGDFEAGDTGFTSDYDYSPCPGTVCTNSSSGMPILCQYDYGIGTNPNDCNDDWSSAISDHTSGSGNMMIVDFPAGDVSPNNRIWCQTVTVDPNTDYCFSAYFINLLPSGSNQPEPIFEFTVDGVLIGTTASLAETEQWESQGFQFNSNASTSVDICIQNNNFGNVGFDLAIDDIALTALNGGTTPAVIADSESICSNESSVTIDVLSNDVPVTTFDNSTLSIESAPPFTEGSITNVDAANGTITFTPSATFSGSTTFSYQICDNNGCCSVANVSITTNPSPEVSGVPTNISCLTTGGIDLTVTGGTPIITYDWNVDSFDGQEDILVTTAGTYDVTVTDANGCSDTASFTITGNETPPVANITPTATELDCNVTVITLDATNSTAQGAITYIWSSGSTMGSIDVSSSGTYTVTVTDNQNGCTATNSIMITADSNPPSANITTTTTVLDCTVSSTILDASTSTTQGTISYEWSTTETTPSITVSAAGTYTVTITDDANGCTATSSVTITQDTTPPVATITSPTSVLDCNVSSIILDASGSTGTGTLTFEWSDNSMMPSLTVNAAGDYTVTVTNGTTGCTATASTTITEDVNDPTANISPTATELDCNVTVITLDATNSTAQGAITYIWSSGSTMGSIDVSSSGTYTVTVTDNQNGCTATNSIMITGDSNPPSANITTTTTVLDCTVSSAILDASTSTTQGTISYDWSTTETTPTITVSAAGTYTVTITDDANGCTATNSVTITQDTTPPVATITSPSTILDCNVSSIILDASGSTGTGTLTFEWSDNSTMPSLTVNAAGDYTVTVTNGTTGCTATASTTITDDFNDPTANITPTAVALDCNVTMITLNASGSTGQGNLSYLWNDLGSSTGSTFDVFAPGTYVVTVTDDQNGCTASTSVAITQDITAPMAVISSPTTEVNCSTDTITLDASNSAVQGTISYEWSNLSTDPTIEVTTAGMFTVTVTDSQNGCTASTTYSVTQDILAPTANIIPSATELNCIVTSINLDASSSIGQGLLGFTWSNNNISPTTTVTSAGTYTVTITDFDNGCMDTLSIDITQDPSTPAAMISPSEPEFNCIITDITLNASGSTGNNLTYEWQDGSTDSTIIVNQTGDYSVTVTDPNNGCTSETSINLGADTAPPLISIPSADELNCIVQCDTLFAITLTGTSYIWSSGDTTDQIIVCTPGDYTVTVTDGINGCTATAIATVIDDIVAPPLVVNTTGKNLNCNIPEIVITAFADVGITYEWNTMETTNSIIVSQPGTYTVTATDPITGCTSIDSTIISQSPDLMPVITGNLLICSGDSTVLDATIPGITDYDWSTGDTTSMITVTMGGEYTVTITNGNCIGTTSVIVTGAITPNPIIIGTNLICEGDTSVLVASMGFVSYEWSSGDTTQNISVILGGTYIVTVTNAEGCTGTESFTVNVNPTPIYGVIDDVASCTNGSVIIGTLTAQGTSYSWTSSPADPSLDDPNNSTPSVNPTVTTTYYLTATNGICSEMDSVTITIEDPMLMVEDDTICKGETSTLTAIGTPTGGTYTWTDWEGNEVGTGESIQVSPALASSYQVTYDLGVCDVSMIVNVDVVGDPNISLDAAPGVNIFLDQSTTISVQNAPAGATFEWFSTDGNPPSGDGIVTVSPTETTTYTVEVTTPEGCIYTESITIFVTIAELAIPNIFTPNGDDLNDDFYIVNGNLGNDVIEFKVFDRWGELIHDHPGTPWDGTFKGKNMPSDIYVYMFIVRMADGTEQNFTGDVALMR